MNRYGLIGRTLKHSFSKTYFTKKFEEGGMADHVYENFELQTIGEFTGLFSSNNDIRGLNVTIPYKEEVIQFLTQQNAIVEAVGACNCILVKGKDLLGYNTDVVGFRNSLIPFLNAHHKQALVLGTGGAAKAVRYVLADLGIEYKSVSRKKAQGGLVYDDVNEEIIASHHLIINTTPLGMYPNVDEAPDLPYHLLSKEHLLFDLTYNPAKTKFLLEGEKRGAKILNGYQMLIEQAEESWRIWSEP